MSPRYIHRPVYRPPQPAIFSEADNVSAYDVSAYDVEVYEGRRLASQAVLPLRALREAMHTTVERLALEEVVQATAEILVYGKPINEAHPFHVSGVATRRRLSGWYARLLYRLGWRVGDWMWVVDSIPYVEHHTIEVPVTYNVVGWSRY